MYKNNIFCNIDGVFDPAEISRSPVGEKCFQHSRDRKATRGLHLQGGKTSHVTSDHPPSQSIPLRALSATVWDGRQDELADRRQKISRFEGKRQKREAIKQR